MRCGTRTTIGRRDTMLVSIDEEDGCKCGETTEPHTCPLSEELCDDDETLCTCCSRCTYECYMDI